MRGWFAKFVLAALVVGTMAPVTVAAQGYPDRPIRMIVSAPSGGTLDFLARVLAPGMARELGQPVVVENRGGANGFLGAEVVAKSAPDGYTVLLTDGAALAIDTAYRTGVPVDILRELTPVGLVAALPSILVANPSFPANNLKELASLAREDPAKVAFASPGVGTPQHLAGVMFSQLGGIRMTHVPYKGDGPMVNDVIAGRVPLLITDALPALLPYLASGKLKALAISSRLRSPLLPSVPTFAEQGYPDFEVAMFCSLFFPANTTPDIVATLLRSVVATLADPGVRRKLEEQTLVVRASGPGALALQFRSDTAKWRDLVKSTGVKLE